MIFRSSVLAVHSAPTVSSSCKKVSVCITSRQFLSSADQFCIDRHSNLKRQNAEKLLFLAHNIRLL